MPRRSPRDIPNLSEDILKDLDEDGIIRIGAEVGPGDILVGKVTPKGETELTAGKRNLLRPIFGEKAREVKDTSLRVAPRPAQARSSTSVSLPPTRTTTSCPPVSTSWCASSVAQKRKVSEGDKMSRPPRQQGRHRPASCR